MKNFKEKHIKLINTLVSLLLLLSLLITFTGCNGTDLPGSKEDDVEEAGLGKGEMMFPQGLMAVETRDDTFGFMDKKGEWVIEPIFDNAHNFTEEGLAYVRVGDNHYFINTAGRRVVKLPDNVWYVSEYSSNGLWEVAFENNKFGFVDNEGNIVIPPVFDWTTGFEKGMARAKYNGYWGYIDELGEFVIDPIYADLGFFDENGMAYACFEGQYGYINRKGEWVIEPEYDRAYEFDSNGLGRVVKNEKYGLIDTNGNYVLRPTYDTIYYFQNGLAAIIEDDEYGYINEKGECVIKPQFENTDCHFGGYADNGLCFVKEFGLWGIIDETGEYVVQPKFEDVGYWNYNGLAPAKLDDKWGYINNHGKFVIDAQFDGCSGFSAEGYAFVCIYDQDDGKNQYGVIDRKGRYIIDLTYDYITEGAEEFHFFY